MESVNLTDNQAVSLVYFFSLVPSKILNFETLIHGFNPLTDPDKYMTQELEENSHSTIKDEYLFRGKFTDEMLDEWMRQELYEQEDYDYVYGKLLNNVKFTITTV